MVGRSNLTEPITIPTKVPSPPRHDDVKYETPSGPAGAAPTIELRVCSEFLEYASNVDYFNSGGKLQVLQDFNDEPMIFAIGRNKLNCLLHEPGKARGWSLTSISPSTDPVVAFDVMKVDQPFDDRNPGLFVTAATAGADGLATVYHSYLAANASGGQDAGRNIDLMAVQWTPFADPDGKKNISTLVIGVNTNRQPGKSSYLITAGSRMQGQKTATFYIIDTTPSLENPWIPFALDTHEDSLNDIQPASIGIPVAPEEPTNREDGIFVLSSRLDRTDCMFYGLDPSSLTKTNSKSTLRGDLGKVNSMYSSRNPWTFTDLVLACEKGIGFISHDSPVSVPITVKGLPQIGYRQVVCSESVDPSNQEQTVFTMFAVSQNNELYYIQGTRQYTRSDGLITLQSSGLPIRANVSRISCQFNAKMNSSELIYVGTGSNEVKHLLRDPITKCWTENHIQFASPKVMKTYQAFLTTISVTSTDGRDVGKDFPVSITAQSTIVLVNDRSYALSTASTTVHTNDRGQLVIVSAASESLMAPTYSCKITQNGISHVATVHGTQRITNLLSKIQGENGISGAKTTTGAPVFSASDIGGNEDAFKESAQFLTEFPTMLSSVGPTSTNSRAANSAESDSVGKEITLGNGGETAAVAVSKNDNALFEDMSEFFGDVIDWVRNVAKQTFKVVFKVAFRGIKILLRIAGKVISLVVDAVGPLVKTIGTFLEERLGIDFKKISQWLGLTWDNEKTKANQMVLREGILKFLKLPEELMRANAPNLEALFDNLEHDLQPFIGDKSHPKVGPAKDPRAGLRNSPLAWLFDNPVLNLIIKLNPMSIIMEALGEAWEEELGDDIKFPNFSNFTTKLREILTKTFENEAEIFFDLLGKLWDRVKDVANDFSKVLEVLKGAMQDIAYALFNAVRTAVRGIWDMMSEMMTLVVTFLDGEWKLPFITPLFKWFADQEFSLMNVFTFLVCRVGGLIFGEDNVKELLDFNGTADSMTKTAKTMNLFGSYGTPRAPEPIFMNLNVASMPMPAVTAKSNEISHSAPPMRITPMSLKANSFGGKAVASVPNNENEHGKEKPGHGGHELSKDAKARIRTYELQSKITSTVIGALRFFTIFMETTHIASEAMAAADPKAKHGDHELEAANPKLILPIMTTVTTGFSWVGSILQLCFYDSARAYSKEVEEHLNEYHTVRKTGLLINFFASTVAFGGCGANVIILTKVPKLRHIVKHVELGTALTTSVGSLAETIAVHMVPEWSHNDSLGNVADVLELVATGAGITAACASYGKAYKVGMVACAADGIITLLSVITGTISMATHTG